VGKYQTENSPDEVDKVCNLKSELEIHIPGIAAAVKIVAPGGAISKPVVRLLLHNTNNFKQASSAKHLYENHPIITR